MRAVPPAPHAEHDASFGAAEWALSVAIALVWGSSFLWIAIAIDDVAAPVVPLARCLFGALALACLPAARRRVDRADLPRLALLALCWMALPFLLYPVAERTVSTSVTGMLNGGLPVVTTIVTALFTRTVPSVRRLVAVAVGAGGIALVSLASTRGGSGADAGGVALLLVAITCYAIAVNVARPVQARYGALPTMLWMELLAVLWSLPLGVPALWRSDATAAAVGSLVVLGAIGTGAAFALYGVLLARAGPVRGMIGIFFTPIVGTLLGVTLRDDVLHPLAVAGMFVVIAGAVLTSRPEPAPPAATATPASTVRVGSDLDL